MSNYRDLIQDLPLRCRDVLNFARGPARTHRREVTLMLMVAATALVSPYERLRRDTNSPHLDAGRFKTSADNLNALLAGPFLGSELWGTDSSSWAYGVLDDIGPEVDYWPEWNSPSEMSSELTAGELMLTLRNGLAHGGVYSFGDPNIERLMFVRRTRDKKPIHYFLRGTPSDLYLLLNNWFEFIQGIHIPHGLVVEALDELVAS